MWVGGKVFPFFLLICSRFTIFGWFLMIAWGRSMGMSTGEGKRDSRQCYSVIIDSRKAFFTRWGSSFSGGRIFADFLDFFFGGTVDILPRVKMMGLQTQAALSNRKRSLVLTKVTQ